MSFDWSQYLDVAKELAQQAQKPPLPLQEAKYRAAISRAYYSAFGKARNHLRYNDKIRESAPLVDSNGERMNIHQYVREAFMNSSDQDRIEIGANLDRMAKNRNVADYDLYNVILNNLPFTVQVTLQWAKDVLFALNRIQKK